MNPPYEHKALVERRFRRPTGRGETREPSLTWEDLTSEPVVVVLGEPGAGKSTELARAATRSPGAAFLTIREFLHANPESSNLFLDALDEMRASGGDRNAVLTQVVQKLIELGRPRVRLSCRAADWFGDLDRDELARCSPSGEVRIVELQPLDENEVEQLVRAHLEDPSAFLETARRQGLEDWLGNPQTLELMIQVAQEGALPKTRTELFEKACALMAQEQNRRHRTAAGQSPVGQREILEAAGFLFAVALITGLEGFAADRDESDSDFPPLDEMPGSQRVLRAAVSSRLFRWKEGRAIPVHRTIAEFLAARSLRNRIAGGLPLARILHIITGHDGGTLSDLRGLFAWLTSLTPEHASELAARDPVALIFYGDPAPLPPSVKRAILDSLEKQALRDPWLFYERGRAQEFGGLADPALVQEFRAALTEPGRPYAFRLSVLAILAYGRPLPDLRESLLTIVHEESDQEHVRELAARALINVMTEEELVPLLEEVHAGSITDEGDRLRGQLLKHLYPQAIKPNVIFNYLTPPKASRTLGSLVYPWKLKGAMPAATGRI